LSHVPVAHVPVVVGPASGVGAVGTLPLLLLLELTAPLEELLELLFDGVASPFPGADGPLHPLKPTKNTSVATKAAHARLPSRIFI
jgi:hypothetical protein